MSLEHIPAPVESNPDPQRGDRWFSYRSMQFVRVERVHADAPQGGRVVLVGEGSGRSSAVLLTDMRNTRFFRFIEPGKVAPPPRARGGGDSKRESVMAQLLAEQRKTNALLEQLLAVWAPKMGGAS